MFTTHTVKIDVRYVSKETMGCFEIFAFDVLALHSVSVTCCHYYESGFFLSICCYPEPQLVVIVDYAIADGRYVAWAFVLLV